MSKHEFIHDDEVRIAVERAILRMPFLIPAFGVATITAPNNEDDVNCVFESAKLATGYTNCVDVVRIIADGMYNNSTGDDQRINVIASLVAHELAHIGLGHGLRTKSKEAAEKASGRHLNHSAWNIALDFECDTIALVAFNDVFASATRADDGRSFFKRVTLPDLIEAVGNPAREREHDVTEIPIFILRWLDRKLDAEAIYDMIMEAAGDDGGDGDDSDGSGDVDGAVPRNVQEMLDALASVRHEIVADVDADGSTAQAASDDARTLQLIRDTMRQLEEWYGADEARGVTPGGVLMRLKELSQPPVSALSNLVNFAANNTQDRCRTWRRLHRPTSLLCGGVAPTTSSAKVPSAMLILDTSGSVSMKDMSEAIGDYRTVCDVIGAHPCEIMYCDSKVHSIDRYECATDITAERVEPTGSGGTSFVPPFEKILERERNGLSAQPDLIIYVTDLYGDFPSSELMSDVSGAVMWCGMNGAGLDWAAWAAFKEACPDKAHFVNYYG